MPLIWPPSLPSSPLVSGFQETAPTLVIRSSMDVGPPKVRRRATSGIGQIQCRYTLSRVLMNTLDDFYFGPAGGGAVAFEWRHPRRAVTVLVRFREPPSYTAEDPEIYTATVALDVLPPGVTVM
jgi:hypothetical protein